MTQRLNTPNVRQIAVILFFHMLFLSIEGYSQTAAPTPKPVPGQPGLTPTPPPIPPTGPAPWIVKGDLLFFTDEDAVQKALEGSPSRKLKLEEFRLHTEGALLRLEQDRGSGLISEKKYKERIGEYRQSIGVYRQLSKSK